MFCDQLHVLCSAVRGVPTLFVFVPTLFLLRAVAAFVCILRTVFTRRVSSIRKNQRFAKPQEPWITVDYSYYKSFTPTFTTFSDTPSPPSGACRPPRPPGTAGQ
jgi:hypothetical protein